MIKLLTLKVNPKKMINRIRQIFNNSERKVINLSNKDLEKIKTHISGMENKSFEDMRKRVTEIKEELKVIVDKIPEDEKISIKKINRREKFPKLEKEVQMKLLEHMPEVFAMINEVHKRKFGWGYHEVQFRAAIILARGQMLVEQYTGEGKTQTFMLPLALYALAGRGAHLVTVNDYLTKIGGEYAGHTLNELGISVGLVAPNGSYRFVSDDEVVSLKGKEVKKEIKDRQMKIDSMIGLNLIEVTKREAYLCDVTYGTNNELGFDYLRDNMSWEIDRIVQRELYFCIIDEADSILIDEARTPLIISSTPSDSDVAKYSHYAQAVEGLEEHKDYVVDYKSRSVNLTEDGIENIEKILGLENLWDDFAAAYHLENALKAKALFLLDDQYVVKNGEVLIVDEFTGRILKGRRYSEGLHQAIEAKEGVDIKEESKTFATITFQNFFRLYKVLSGGSGTIMTESEEFYKIYGLDSIAIPTNRPNVREDHPDRIYKTQEAKFRAVVDEIKEMNEIGRPVLVGTTSVEKSEVVSRLLDEEGIEHEVLNAKYHEEEARIVAKAGIKGAVTVATNMAGRGTDIVIGGGRRGDKSYQEIVELGGLHVIGTERHDSRRIDNQLRGRTGRQGEPGSTRFYASLDDQIMRILGGEILARLMNAVRVPENMPIEMKLISRQIEMAQKRVESLNFDNRKRIVEYDDVMNAHREVFYARRRSILDNSERVFGKFVIGNQIIDVNNDPKLMNDKKYKDMIKHSQKRLEDAMKEIIDEQIDTILDQNLREGSRLSKNEVENFVEKLNEVIPQRYLEKAFEAKLNEMPEKLQVKLNESNIDRPSFVIERVNKVYEAKVDDFGGDFYNLCKMLVLENLDKKWVEHLEVMKDVRDGVGLQGYAQKDPLVEYKNQAFYMFESFINIVNKEISSQFFSTERVSRVVERNADALQTNVRDIEDVLTGDREVFVGGTDAIGETEPVAKSVTSRMNQLSRSRRQRTSIGVSERDEVKGGGKRNEFKNLTRNSKVSVRMKDGSVKKGVKFKTVEDLLLAGDAVLVK